MYGIFTYIYHKKSTKKCRWIYQPHGSYGNCKALFDQLLGHFVSESLLDRRQLRGAGGCARHLCRWERTTKNGNHNAQVIQVVTFLRWLSDPLKWLSDLQLGDEKVTLNHLGGVLRFVCFVWHFGKGRPKLGIKLRCDSDKYTLTLGELGDTLL